MQQKYSSGFKANWKEMNSVVDNPRFTPETFAQTTVYHV